MKTLITRRTFLQHTAIAAGAATLAPGLNAALSPNAHTQDPILFRISLAQWSLHRALRSRSLDHLDFPKTSKEDYGIDAIELVNQFFKDKARDQAYLGDFKKRADDLGVKTLLIMCDGEGALGDADEAKRKEAVENHYRWIEATKFLGGHSIRVNAQSSGTPEEQADRVADGLRRLSEFGATHEINVIVENHGGLSSRADWLMDVIKKVNLPNCGTLPDFGNFYEYDRYKGVEEMMPHAKGVSAKSNDFDADGNETRIDYMRMLRIVLSAGYRGYVGIEYEGNRLSEPEGIRATKALLERVRTEIIRTRPQRIPAN